MSESIRGEGGRVWVTLSEENGLVKATVSDTGVGIQKEDLSRIFDKFYRVKSTETRQIVGTGLLFYVRIEGEICLLP